MSNWRSSHPAERRDTHKNNRENRRDRNDETHRDRSQRSRDRDHRGGRRDHSRRDDEKQNEKRKHERSPSRRENSHPRHRERNERSRSRDRREDSGRRRNDQHRQKRSPEDGRMKRESSADWGKSAVKEEKEKPNFELSGKLTEDMNTVNGVVIKYSEPQDAKKPKRRWRLYPFKGEKALPTLYIHRQSAYLMGRDRKVADIPLDHPSCSKQHAALQYRLVSYQKEGGAEGRRIRPYIIDLESANGTFVNNVKLEPRRYHELLEKDVVRFGFSTREYVLLHEHSKDDSFDDDVPLTNET
ncbi:smad nuclear-interacting protein 1 [Temnothorax longispinosus]|uniref:FHA domain-containing protein n=1 Tax=Temnothorax longispinosus TaxID=300112 RepID=A0A4S2KDC8_9HYME|nr:Uncharacterized protein DBV15_04205 [Temnothorax longispinosus]